MPLMLLLNVTWLTMSGSIMLQSINIITLMIIFVVSSILSFSYYYLINDVAVGVFNFVYLIFLGSMVLLLTSCALVIFLGWESISLISMMLISYWRRPASMSGAMSAIIYNRWGDYFFIISYLYVSSELLLYTCLLSIISNSSIYLYIYWLPVAIEGPTPVSSLLHSSTIVVAGVYLSIMVNVNLIIIIIVLVLSYFLYNQMDVKNNIALSTSLHLTLILMLVLMDMISYVIVYIILHGMINGQLFQMSGYTLHSVGIQDLRNYSGVISVVLMVLIIWLLTAMVSIGIVGIKELLMFSLESLIVIIIILLSLYYTLIFMAKVSIVMIKGEVLSIYVIVVIILSIVVIQINITLWLFVLVIVFIVKVIANSQFSTVL